MLVCTIFINTFTTSEHGNYQKTVTFSLDPAFVAQESQNAKVTYYWSLAGHKAGRKASYVVDTSALDEGMYRVQVRIYKTPTGGTRVVSDGWGMFEVVKESVKVGTIDLIIRDIDTGHLLSNHPYLITYEDNPVKKYSGETESNGVIRLEGLPIGNYKKSMTFII